MKNNHKPFLVATVLGSAKMAVSMGVLCWSLVSLGGDGGECKLSCVLLSIFALVAFFRSSL